MGYDFFEQLDRTDSRVPGEPSKMIRYRTRFHKDIIYSNLSTNPLKSIEEIAAAVAINSPARFLPQPWPPLPIADDTTLSVISLIKMKAMINVSLWFPEANSERLEALIEARFPKRAFIEVNASSTVCCEACVNQNGEVTFGFDSHESPMDTSLQVNYVRAMLILGMQIYQERIEGGTHARIAKASDDRSV